MGKCPVCGIEVEKPVREIDMGPWSLSIIRDYECCDRKFREYIRKTKESLNLERNKGKTIKRYITLNREPMAQLYDEAEWSNEESFHDAEEW